jgi:hypothetical protein
MQSTILNIEDRSQVLNLSNTAPATIALSNADALALATAILLDTQGKRYTAEIAKLNPHKLEH